MAPSPVALALLGFVLALMPLPALAQIHPPDARWPRYRQGSSSRPHRWVPQRVSPFVMGGGALMAVPVGGHVGGWMLALGAERPTSHTWALVPRLAVTVNNDPAELLWARAGAAIRFSSSNGGALGYWEFGPALGLARGRLDDGGDGRETGAAASVRAAVGMRGRPAFGPVWMIEINDELGTSPKEVLFAVELALGVAF